MSRKRSHVVKPEDMIGVMMRKEHGVRKWDSLPKELLPQVRRGVDEDASSRSLDEHAGAQSMEARVLGLTDLAPAAYDGDACRRTGAEEHKFPRRALRGRCARHSPRPFQGVSEGGRRPAQANCTIDSFFA